MIEPLLKAYRFNFAYAKRLLEGIDDTQAALSGGPGLENHPVFVIGHLVTGAGLTANYLGGENTVDEKIRDAFERKGPADTRMPEFGGKEFAILDLLQELEIQHGLVESRIRSLPVEQWAELKSWRLSEYFPTLYDTTWFMCVIHESLHLGQLAAWRRAKGMPSAMAQL